MSDSNVELVAGKASLNGLVLRRVDPSNSSNSEAFKTRSGNKGETSNRHKT